MATWEIVVTIWCIATAFLSIMFLIGAVIEGWHWSEWPIKLFGVFMLSIYIIVAIDRHSFFF
jgi:hypothetical protein